MQYSVDGGAGSASTGASWLMFLRGLLRPFQGYGHPEVEGRALCRIVGHVKKSRAGEVFSQHAGFRFSAPVSDALMALG